MSTPFRCRSCGRWSDFLVVKRSGSVCPGCAARNGAPWAVLVLVVAVLGVLGWFYLGKGF